MCEPDVLLISGKYANNPNEAAEIAQNARVYISSVVNDKNKVIDNFQHYMKKIVSCMGKSFRREQKKYSSRFVSLDSCSSITLPSGKSQLRTIAQSLVDNKASNPLDAIYLKEVIEKMKELPKLQQIIMQADAGVGNPEIINKSTTELAEYLGVSPNLISKNRERAIKKLAKIAEYK